MSGAFFVPTQARAGFLSAMLGEEASASTSISIPIPENNSQNMVLLEANVFSVSSFVDKKTKNIQESSEVSGNIEVSIMSNNALLPTVGPLGVVDEAGIGGDVSSDQISVYVVRKGDSLSQIAEMYGVTIDTILSANDMQKGDTIKEGDVLLILPFSGVEHVVAKGDTIKGIATKYKIEVNDILAANELDVEDKLVVGDKLVIPGGSLTGGVSGGGSVAKGGASSGSSLKNASGYFINPVPSAKKSRGTTATHKGVDLAAPVGTPIYASASGRVKFARNGYNGGFGNLVIISHPNGTETLYAHQSSIKTSVGSQVKQGDVIGYVGNTGRSRGAHLHFEVHGAKNPGNDWSWKR